MQSQDASVRGNRPRRRRRLRKLWVPGLLIALVAFVWLIPQILSGSLGESLLENYINDRIEGSLSIEDLRLTWFAPIVISNLSVLDPENREVLTIQELSYANGLLGAARHPERFGSIRAVRPVAVIRLDADGSNSLSRTFASSHAPTGDHPRAVPQLIGKFLAERGVVKLVRPDGRAYELREVEIDLNVDMLGLLEGEARLQTPEGGRLSLSVSLNGLADEGELKVGRADGLLALSTDRPVDIGPIAEFLGSEAIAGAGKIELRGNISSAGVSGNVAVSISDLRSQAAPRAEGEPIDAKLAGTFRISSDRVSTALHLTSDVGELRGNLTYGPSQSSRGVQIKKLLAAAFGGRCGELPDFSLDVSGRIDLSELVRFDPGALRILPGVDITSGELEMRDVSIRTRTSPRAKGKFDLKDLTARKGRSTLRFRPISLRFDGVVEEGTGLDVRELALESAFARIEARGTLTNMRGKFDVDLGRFREQLGQIFKLGADLPTGRIDGSIDLTRRDENRVDFRIETNARDLNYRSGDTRRIVIDRCRISHRGSVLIRDKSPQELIITQSSIKISDGLLAKGSGRFRVDDGAFHYELEVPRTELSDIENILKGFRPSWLPRATGGLDLSVSVDRLKREAKLTCNGLATVNDLRVEDRTVTPRPITLEWSGLKRSSLAAGIDVDRVSVNSEPLDLQAEKLSLISGPGIQLRGRATLSADIAKCLSGARALTNRDRPGGISGALRWEGKFAPVEDALGLSGAGTIEDLQVSTHERTVRTGKVEFRHSATFDPAFLKLALKRLEISSKLISGQVSGRASKLDDRWDLDLTGKYEGSWEEIMDLAAQFIPGLRDRVVVSGKTGDDLTILGAIHDPGVQPQFRRLKAATGLGWTKAEVLGVPIGQAKISAVLSNGMIGMSRQVVRAGTGTLEIGGIIDFRSTHPVYRLPGHTRVLDRLTITPELTHDLLGRFNPIFAELTEVDGEVSLDVADLELPLDESIKRSGKGSGHLDLSQLTVRPRGILGELVRLAMLVPPDEAIVETPGMDFAISDGRIHYDEFRLVFPNGSDMRFFGSVGFDDTLDMAVSVPVSLPLLERLGVKGLLTEYIRVLKGVRVVIPLAGTRIRPILDFSELDIAPALRRAAELLAAEKIREVFGDIFSPPVPDKTTPKRRPDHDTEEKPIDELLDPLFDLLRKQED